MDCWRRTAWRNNFSGPPFSTKVLRNRQNLLWTRRLVWCIILYGSFPISHPPGPLSQSGSGSFLFPGPPVAVADSRCSPWYTSPAYNAKGVMSYENDEPVRHTNHDANHYGGTTLDQNSYGITQARVAAVHKERYALTCEHGDLCGRLKTRTYRIIQATK